MTSKSDKLFDSASKTLSVEEYLSRSGVTNPLRDAVTLLLENRPEQPIVFLADYFRQLCQPATPLPFSYHTLRASPRHRDIFFDNVAQSYNILVSQKNTQGDQNAVLTGNEFFQLLKLLCMDFPMDIWQTLLVILNKREVDVIDFIDFQSCLRTVVLYEEFFEKTEHICYAFDIHCTGVISRRRALAVIREASKTLDSAYTIPTQEELDVFAAALAREDDLLDRDTTTSAVGGSATVSGTVSGKSMTGNSSGSGAGTAAGNLGLDEDVSFEDFIRILFKVIMAKSIPGP
eukprot:TRINITY_DN11737_c0_g1::TRINITY_DN11737_c0_g1_i1::g.11605::m.11605 TRINITY_DN11737_c0_g1::TRINITY_DN11737_c0_g1_i1::g.11605  ORF type:complete len:289 (-),score=21.36,sp/Q8BHR8/CK049_MOUSE/29.87/2e-09,Dpy-30/PF05186.8/0.0026,EF-hand_8/PF13833.1/2,EF-hand_8/PF13833.1/95,RIIa/PF02197.12/0.1 TRINITY_DN11737_c0_g1_i1:109-975(-)